MLHATGAPLLPKLRGYFAEFLNEGFLARLRILTPPTCVGLRYGHLVSLLEVFLDSMGSSHFGTCFPSPSPLRLLSKTVLPVLHPTGLDALFQSRAWLTLLCHPILIAAPRWHRILNRLSITYAFRPRLRSRLTLGGRAFPRKP